MIKDITDLKLSKEMVRTELNNTSADIFDTWHKLVTPKKCANRVSRTVSIINKSLFVYDAIMLINKIIRIRRRVR
ncbi:MAG: hypothetical protein KBS94_00365 [Prevotella sp.]|nr:hypothetical protein [Candidatus Equicola faecalis]MDO4819345.1 hypothetical protein [Prevotella sp.]